MRDERPVEDPEPVPDRLGAVEPRGRRRGSRRARARAGWAPARRARRCSPRRPGIVGAASRGISPVGAAASPSHTAGRRRCLREPRAAAQPGEVTLRASSVLGVGSHGGRPRAARVRARAAPSAPAPPRRAPTGAVSPTSRRWRSRAHGRRSATRSAPYQVDEQVGSVAEPERRAGRAASAPVCLAPGSSPGLDDRCQGRPGVKPHRQPDRPSPSVVVGHPAACSHAHPNLSTDRTEDPCLTLP